MLRDAISAAYKDAMRAKDQRSVSTLRLIQAALKDRDIAARGRGVTEGVDDAEITEMLAKMVKQRRESIALYEQGGRLELAEQEQEEIAVIERFLPQQLTDEEASAAIDAAIAETGAAGLKDMGKCMAALKAKHAGVMDFAKAGAAVKAKLGG